MILATPEQERELIALLLGGRLLRVVPDRYPAMGQWPDSHRAQASPGRPEEQAVIMTMSKTGRNMRLEELLQRARMNREELEEMRNHVNDDVPVIAGKVIAWLRERT